MLYYIGVRSFVHISCGSSDEIQIPYAKIDNCLIGKLFRGSSKEYDKDMIHLKFRLSESINLDNYVRWTKQMKNCMRFSMLSTNKYSEALTLYTSTQLSIKEICEHTHISFVAFCSYLSRNHRDLILKRHRLDGLKDVKLRGSKGQTSVAHIKYHDAIVAADSMEYIEYNISQIARIFGLNSTGLAGQLRRHYPEIIPRREKERHRLGINDNIHHGVRQWCKEGFAEAVDMLRETDLTVREAADVCKVRYRGLMAHLLVYHQDLVSAREEKRKRAVTE